jgi:hypothetical protein
MKQRGTKLREPSLVDEVKPLTCDRTRYNAGGLFALQWHPSESALHLRFSTSISVMQRRPNRRYVKVLRYSTQSLSSTCYASRYTA